MPERDPSEEDRERSWVLAAQRDPGAFSPLYERYHRAIYLFVVKRIGDREKAGDLTQQVFLKALIALPRFEFRGVPFKAWLYRIAFNEVLMHYRSNKGRFFMDVEAADAAQLLGEATGIDPSARSEEELVDLAKALGRLRPAQAALIELHWFDGLSYAEVAQVLGIAEAAAKMRTHRVLQTLRGYLREPR